jgi:predicted PurR-regulated permease PerM
MQAANITDQDIDAIIQKGQRATEELNEKMKQFTENAMKFTLDGGFNAYEFKDEDDMPEDVPNLKALAGRHALLSCYLAFFLSLDDLKFSCSLHSTLPAQGRVHCTFSSVCLPSYLLLL